MKLPRRRTSPRAVLLGAVLFIALGSGVYLVAPWVLPVRIVEGPMVQGAGEHGATLIWYTTRPVDSGSCQVDVTVAGEDRTLPAEADGCRQRVRIDGLAPGELCPYEIRLGRRTLAHSTLHTDRPASEPFSFIVFGDSGRGTQAQYLLAARMGMVEYRPDFVLHTGDLVYGAGEREKYGDRFFAPYRALLAEINFWPALGNHDIKTDGGQPYFDVFELPENGPAGLPAESNYWFDYAAARVVVIDSNLDEVVLRDKVAQWLRDVFAARPEGWRFVSLHHPPYTAGAYKPDVRVQRALVPVFEEAGVDVVFSGHDHMYERTYPLRGGQVVERGVVYVVSGAGGAGLYEALPPDKRPAYIAALNNDRYSFTQVRIDGDTLRLRQVDVDGHVLDEWELGKTIPTSAPASAPAASQPGVPAP
ncbi:MAG: metallophosphoesterase [Phycisphaerae bacterium]|jgi:hypothetical protein